MKKVKPSKVESTFTGGAEKSKASSNLNARINFSGKPIKNENILNKRIKFFNSVKPNL